MKSKVAGILFAVLLSASARDWQVALPGYRYQFPRDHFSHPEYQTEWWYYTGNLRAADGHRFGFELTFFRVGMNAPRQPSAGDATWWPDQIYLAHLALSDIDGGEFYHTERVNRAGPGLAGIDFAQQRYWNGNWQVRWQSVDTGQQELQAVCQRFKVTLELTPEKPFVIHGKNGVSQKAAERGKASHYISFTRLRATGQLHLKGRVFSLEGLAWMDHEFFTEQLDSSEAGWDWFAIQLENREELMLYRLRKKSGEADPYSSGTYVDAGGKSHFLTSSEIALSPREVWRSPSSGAKYPIAWTIRVPSLDLDLREETALNDQELLSTNSYSPSYWEGAVTYSGHIHAEPVSGVGYLEMTGYQRPLQLGSAQNN